MKTKRTYVKTDGHGNLVRPHETPEQVAARRAAHGAGLLDYEVPGWADVINLDALDVGEMDVDRPEDLSKMSGCVLCQVDLAITNGTCTSGGTPIQRPGQSVDDFLAEQDFYARERKKLDGIDVDLTDAGDDDTRGSYVRLAKDLGLNTPQSKVDHGFLADKLTTYPALDAAWTAEIEARR